MFNTHFLLATWLCFYITRRGTAVLWHDEAKQSANRLGQSVDGIVNNLMGAQDLQRYYDTLAFTHRKLNGTEILNTMSSQLGQKIFDRNTVIKGLQKTVQDSLRTFPSAFHNKECCHLDTSTMEFDDRFKQLVGKDSCYRRAKSTSGYQGSLTQKFDEACKKNLRQMPFLTWQYFSSEAGMFTVYPALQVSDCVSYDGRFRPFYVQANVPEPKDVVLVIDKSGSMGSFHSSSDGGSTLMEIAKEAAKTVINTLNPHDQVAVVTFSSSASVMGVSNRKEGCFGRELALATTENVKSIVQFIDETTAGGGTLYGAALEKAFQFFDASTSGGNRDKVILFLSDGQPSDSRVDIIRTLKERNGRLNNSVIVMSYGLGNADFSVLREMANEAGTLYGESGKSGLFTHVSNPSNLRRAMGSYYSFFAAKTTHSSLEPIWSLPYLDKFGLGVLMSVTLPVNDNSGKLAGVVGTDLTMEDFVSDAMHFRPSKLSYIFIIDSFGFVIYHPLFKYPENHDVKYVEISAFETDTNMVDVIQSMKRGGRGSKTFESEKVAQAGSNRFYGVNTFWVTTQVFWKKIPNSDFSLCVVLTQNDEESTMQHVDPQPGDDFLYHRVDLVEPQTPCRHYNNYGAMNQSSVSLGPRAFSNTDSYTYKNETKQDVQTLKNYMLTGRGGSTIKAGIRDSVWATQESERFWKTNSHGTYEAFVMWRYVGTKEGIMRIYPGNQLPKEFDATVRPWYLNALANRGKATFTLPYLDASSGQYVMSISKAVFEGKPGGVHNVVEDEVVAVLSSDILTLYISELVNGSYPMCLRKSGGRYAYDCKLIDSAGFIIFDNNNANSHPASPKHITQVEQDISRSLISQKIMESSKCLVVENTEVQRSYRIVGKVPYYHSTSDCVKYQFSPIPRTNIYMIVKDSSRSCPSFYCPCSFSSLENRQCLSSNSVCQCPCKSRYQEYNTCANNYTNTRSSDFPKPCVPPPKQLTNVGRHEGGIDRLPKCSKYSYEPSLTTGPPSFTTTTSATVEETDSSSTVSINLAGIIAGVCVSVVVIIILAILVRFCCVRGKRQKLRKTKASWGASQHHVQSSFSGPPQTVSAVSSAQPMGVPPHAMGISPYPMVYPPQTMCPTPPPMAPYQSGPLAPTAPPPDYTPSCSFDFGGGGTSSFGGGTSFGGCDSSGGCADGGGGGAV